MILVTSTVTSTVCDASNYICYAVLDNSEFHFETPLAQAKPRSFYCRVIAQGCNMAVGTVELLTSLRTCLYYLMYHDSPCGMRTAPSWWT